MFNFKLRSFLVVSILLLCGITAANAQLVDGNALKIDIPNSFLVRDKVFPAGTYTIARTPDTNDSTTMLILRGENRSIIFDTMQVTSKDVVNETKLVFENVGANYFLNEIWIKGSTTALAIRKTNLQTALVAQAPARRYVVAVEPGL